MHDVLQEQLSFGLYQQLRPVSMPGTDHGLLGGQVKRDLQDADVADESAGQNASTSSGCGMS
eukprot:359545-Chlamydomonas_euryale.AAC.4